MRYSVLFPKTKRSAPSGTELKSTEFLYRAGYIDQLMAGVFSLLPLGWRVSEKVKQVIREEMDAIGGQELLMPSLQPKELWEETGRWESLTKGDIMYHLVDRSGRELGLPLTQEETALDLIRKHTSSYKDYPIYLYHFSTKFREEPRPRGGLLRVREFTMKDLYSAHTSKEDFDNFYEIVKDAYLKIFDKLGLAVKVVEASGGVFTKEHTHEFQVLTDIGEDTVYFCQKCDFAQNKEIAEVAEGDKCPKCGGLVAVSRAVEVGNIFSFGSKYSKDMNVSYTDQDGQKKIPFFGSYGIGLGRVLAVIADVYADDKGLAWPEVVAPFLVHIVSLNQENMTVRETAAELEKKLVSLGVAVLYDDREESVGVKLADADLIGNPWRVVVSERSIKSGGVEIKRRNSDQVTVVSIPEFLKKFSQTNL